jgi:hypothetical protein
MTRCTKQCRMNKISQNLYVCKQHNFMHSCGPQCKATIKGAEGTFCYLTGLQVDDVEYISYDNVHSCTRVAMRMSASTKACRKRAALAKVKQRMCPVPVVADIIRRLFCEGRHRTAVTADTAGRISRKIRKHTPAHAPMSLAHVMSCMRMGVSTAPARADSPWVVRVAQAISAFSSDLNLPVTSQTAAASFPVVFTATVCSKMAVGEVFGERVIVPRVPWIGAHGFSDVHFNRFGVSCRAMSLMWRQIKAVARADEKACVVGRGSAQQYVQPNPALRNRFMPCAKGVGRY